MPFEVKPLALTSIRTNGGTQTRVALNAPAVREYGEAMTEGAKLPPVTVFFDGTDHWLADGFHRVQASMDIGALSIEAEIRPGNQRDARLYSVGANAAHGLRRTNDDKRRAVSVLLEDAEWKTWSDREIARQCTVSRSLVAEVRSHLAEKPDNTATNGGEKTVERGGKTYTQKTSGVAESNQKRAKEKASAKDSEPSGKKPEEPAATTVATPIEKHDESPGPVQATKPAESGEVERLRADLEAAGEFVAEQGANLQTLLDEVIELRKVCEADDKLAAAAAVIKQKTAENRVLREQLNGAMATTAEAQRAAKSWRAKHDKLAKEIERARSV